MILIDDDNYQNNVKNEFQYNNNLFFDSNFLNILNNILIKSENLNSIDELKYKIETIFKKNEMDKNAQNKLEGYKEINDISDDIKYDFYEFIKFIDKSKFFDKNIKENKKFNFDKKNINLNKIFEFIENIFLFNEKKVFEFDKSINKSFSLNNILIDKKFTDKDLDLKKDKLDFLTDEKKFNDVNNNSIKEESFFKNYSINKNIKCSDSILEKNTEKNEYFYDNLQISKHIDRDYKNKEISKNYSDNIESDKILVQKLSEKISLFKNKGVFYAKLKVYPENLGNIKISLKYDSNKINICFFLDNLEIKNILENSIKDLKKTLLENGIILNETSFNNYVDVNLNDNKQNSFYDYNHKKNLYYIYNESNDEFSEKEKNKEKNIFDKNNILNKKNYSKYTQYNLNNLQKIIDIYV